MGKTSSRHPSPELEHELDAYGKAYHHGNLKLTLLDAALALIAERGANGFTLREVARRAGVSHAAPYRHFSDRAALLAAAAERELASLRERLREARSRSPDQAPAQLRAAARCYLRYAAERPARFAVVFGQEVAPRLGLDGMLADFAEAIAADQGAGQLRGADPHELAAPVFAAVHGAALLAADGRLAPADPALSADRLVDLLHQGLEP